MKRASFWFLHGTAARDGAKKKPRMKRGSGSSVLWYGAYSAVSVTCPRLALMIAASLEIGAMRWLMTAALLISEQHATSKIGRLARGRAVNENFPVIVAGSGPNEGLGIGIRVA